ncbi:amino acid adenylation domain-containing protein [Amycolatopsis sp. lyj-23]|uniref:amino acid adenylation domain-containing protein n=1 Tax=Amycolatopsis sp. lyj-23 TaxID=2789283 RepID=UPI00397988E3
MRDVADIYPLSPLQQGLLFHTVADDRGGMYVEQVAFRVEGRFDPGAFARAWQRVVDRHPALRTSFLWQKLAQPVQVVHREVRLDVVVEDWRGASDAERERRLAAFLRADHVRGFDPARAPLLRITLIRLAEDAWEIVCSNHHLIFDGWSRATLLREVMAYYTAAPGTDVELPAVRPFRDYVAWLQTRDDEAAGQTWRAALSGFTTPTTLPFGTAEPGAAGSAGVAVELDEEATAALRRMCRAHGLTTSTVVQAAWGALLGKHSGTDDVVFGVTVAGRPPELTGAEDMVGLFINTVPVRVRWSAGQPVGEWLQELQRTVAGLRQYEHTPLASIRAVSDVPGGVALFDSLVVFENYPAGDGSVRGEPDTVVRDVRVAERTEVALTLVAAPGDRLSLRLLYATDRYDEPAAAGLLGRLTRLLAAMAADPAQPVHRLRLLSAADEQELLRRWNPDAAEPAAAPAPLVTRFLAQARTRPDAVAVVWGQEQLTYGAVLRRAAGLAGRLRAAGVGPETLVGVLSERGPRQVVAVLACHLAGGAYLPLDPAYPAERIGYLVADSRTPIVVTTADLVARVPAGPAVVVLDEREAEPVDARVDPAQLAYVIYTSGSTGRPKGVLVPHGNAARLFDATRRWSGFDTRDTWSLFHSIAFDFSVWELWGALAHGGRLVLVGDMTRRSPEEFAELLAEQAVTVLNQTPSAFLPLAAVADELPALRTVVFGGEALPADQLAGWASRTGLRRPRLVNMYGITETTVHVTHHRVTDADLRPGAGSVIGRPIADLRVYLLDADLRPVPPGMAGELYVGGAGPARGYLGRPGLTAQRFVPDPHGGPGTRVYRTGDRARALPDGTFVYLGRSDGQVQVRGHRVEPGEVEAALRTHPRVTAAHVLLRDHRLVAYLVTTGDVPDVREHLAASLPSYLHPAHYVVVDAFPLTAHGKIDIAALPAPSTDRARSGAEYAEPGTAAERVLAEIWQDILGVDAVGVHDNFFALGGDSILSMRIAARAMQAGLRINPRQLFEHETVAELAAAAGAAGTEPAAPVEPDPVGPFPLTPVQSWFFAAERPAPHHFNQAFVVRLDQPADPAVLRAALAHLTAKHPALRLRFEQRPDGRWQQRIAEPADHPELLRCVDLSASADPAGSFEEIATRAQASMDLDGGLLLRAVHVRLGDDGERLLLVVHHLGVDGVSWRILLADLAAACAALAHGGPVPASTSGTSFAAWATRLAEYAESDEAAAEIPYWREMVRSASARLPVDFPGTGPLTAGGTATVTRSLSRRRTRDLLHAGPARVRPVEVMLAALGRTLGEWSGHDRVVVDTEGHGREPRWTGVDLTGTVGWFTSLHPLELAAGDAVPALRHAKARLRSVPDGGIGYQLLVYGRGVRFGAADREVLFNYLGQFDDTPENGSGWRLSGEPAGKPQDDAAPRRYALEVSAAVANGKLQVRWTYSPGRHREVTVARLASRFLDRVTEFAAAAEDAALATPEDFPLAAAGQDAVDRFAALPGGLEDLYPLSPTQQGMLFHLLYAPEGGVNVEQVTCRLTGDLDVPSLRSAWAAVVARHPVLRTSFHWRDGDTPLQAVHRKVELPWRELDWRDRTAAAQRDALTELLRADRAERFRTESAPLMRLTLVRTGEDTRELIWTHHHLLLDGWSLARVFQEVLAFQRAALTGVEFTPAPARPYRDYLGWLADRDPAQAEAFWRKEFGDFTAPTPLPAEPGEPVPGTGAATEIVHLTAGQTAAVQECGRRNQVTLGTLVHAAWALVLHRHSMETGVVFGTVVAGRPADLPGVEGMVGQFINTQPVRLVVEPDRPALDWLRDVQCALADARQFEFTPLVEIHGCSAVSRDQPLFESVLVFENYLVEQLPEATAARPAGMPAVDRLRGLEQTGYPLTLIAAPGEQVRLQLLYDGDRFCAQTAHRLLEQVRTVLGALADDPRRVVADLPVLAEDEVRQVLAEWNDTAVPFPLDRTFPQLFQAQVTRTPDALAVVDDDRELTYAELAAAAARLAHHLRGLGVGPETKVALCLDRSIDLIIAILAVWQAGGAYLPVDSALSAERIAFMLTDARAAVVVTTSATRAVLPPTDAHIVCVDSDDAVIAAHPAEPPDPRTGPGHLAYVIYTSGSTGVPKGAMVEQRGMVNHLLAKVRALGLSPDDTVAATASPSFDISVWQFFSAVLAGGTVRVFADRVAHDPVRLIAETARRHVTILEVVPSMLRAIEASPTGPDLPALRWLLLTGEALPADLCRTWLTRYPRIPLLNAYGPTECSDDVTHHVIAAPPAADASGVPIGTPLPNTRLYVLDDRQRPAPVGAPGELCVGGSGVGRGYAGRPGRTASAFVPDPFGPPGARLYRTGDLVRAAADGTLEFLGRIDHQVKLRGFRIELGEIEAVLHRHPAVRDAVVLLREDVPGNQQLVGYVVTGSGDADLRAHCAERLPGHMVPSAFVRLDELPLTPNGKLDRRALPAVTGFATAAETDRPRPGMEELVATVWSSVLGGTPVGRQSVFFALGGHSLSAMRVIARLSALVHAELPLRALFDHPALADFARFVERAGAADDGAPAPAPAPRTGNIPLSFAQQRLWFLDRWAPGSSAYNLPMAVRLTGELNVAALADGLRTVVRRHESLRTTIACDDGAPYQVIAATPDVRLPMVDLSGLDRAAAVVRARSLAEQDARTPFDLETGPLLRAALVRLAGDDHVLLLNLHHIVSDGWSSGVLVAELTETYTAAVEERPAVLADLPVQYADFAVWQRDLLSGDRLERELAHWREKLAGAPGLLALPADRPRPAVQTHRGANLAVDLPAKVAAAARELAGEEGATVFMVLFAAFAAVLSGYSGQRDLLVGTPIANRSRPELEPLIGFFANTLVLRADLSGAPTGRELLARVRDTTVDAYTHQDVPFELLVDAVQPERSPSHSPLVQVLFVLQNAPAGGAPWPGLEISALHDEPAGDTARFDLTLSVRESAEGLHANVEYATDLFDEETIVRLVRSYESVLGAMAGDPDRRVPDLPLLPAPELAAQATLTGPRAELPEAGLAALVRAQARLTPDSVAVASAGRELTYRALWAKAERLAHRLRACGTGPEDRVGVCLDRSPELVVALLGVLIAGAAYLPLDPEHPAGRLASLLADGDVAVLVTDRPPPSDIEVVHPSDGAAAERGPLPEVAPDNLAYVIYTSGSTGRPKAAMNTHRAIVNRLRWMQDTYRLDGADRVLQKTPVTFDVSVWEFFWPLLTGARLVLADPGGHRDPRYLAELADEQAVTTAHFVPAMLSAFVDAPESARASSLRRLIASGEALAADVVRAVAARLPGVPLHNLYGPTEAAVDVTHWRCPPDPAEVPLGEPVANTRIHVLDHLLRPVPAGVAGELCIGGIQVGRGYHGLPGLTAERFVPDPAGAPGARLYRTGDQVRLRAGGVLEFLGRLDHQVKIRGLRIEPGEVDAVLVAHPDVRAAVTVVHGTGDSARLVGYVVADAEVDDAALRAHCGRTLPAYVVPASFVRLAELPLSPNGKIDRKALRPSDGDELGGVPYRAPATPSEERVAKVWQVVLGVPEVGADDDFFALGGHSLLATRVHARLRAEFRADLPLRALFELPTVAGLAAELDRRSADGPVASAHAIRAVGRDGYRRRKSELRTPRATTPAAPSKGGDAG